MCDGGGEVHHAFATSTLRGAAVRPQAVDPNLGSEVGHRGLLVAAGVILRALFWITSSFFRWEEDTWRRRY